MGRYAVNKGAATKKDLKILENQVHQVEEKSQEDQQESFPEVEEQTVYGDDYWGQEHERHQALKKMDRHERQEPKAQKARKAERLLYEDDLKAFLRMPVKKRELIQGLAQRGFITEPNHVGNGSSHTVRAAPHHPFFGQNTEYASAYFNLHLPTDDIIMPYGYYRHLKSGLRNIFGVEF